ncbi:MAG: radical SAM protein [Cytophagales bacterium]|nr:radical SAM protein [Cytophagales bacterium]
MKKPVSLLITPPLTQLNTPYPATAYLKGYLEKLGYESHQVDLGIELVLQVFSENGLSIIFEIVEDSFDLYELERHHQKILLQKEGYIHTIHEVIRFLQHKNPSLAHRICTRNYLPEGKRFNEQLEKMDWAFGTLTIHDKARFLATLYLEDLGDFIRETIAPEFEFSRYAEKLALSATSFDPIHEHLQQEDSLLDTMLIQLLDSFIQEHQPDLVGFSVPFPGNVYGAFKCAQYIKENYPEICTVMGGGYPNTELRSLQEPLVFDYFDFITLDDGEAPVVNILEFLEGKCELDKLQRTFYSENGKVKYINGQNKIIPHTEVGTPNYEGLPLSDYLSVIDVLNPMHRLWSDGRWNKLTVAHGCYWKRCSFCDVTLDYIERYDVAPAVLLVDRIEEIIEQTGETGFHFVDEAAPPLALRDLALELIKRKVNISWWANIRFEKTFTHDLSKLLAQSGCIAVSGGLEVASDRLLALMEKGVTIDQVARVTDGFTKAGIMVHAYLMYGFPTQTEQETINSLEIVRQLFEAKVIQSGYWHQFSMTVHSPVGKNPAKYQVKRVGPPQGTFANNDLIHTDPLGCEHESFTQGLKASIYNFMHGVGLDYNPQDWFDFETPSVSISNSIVKKAIANIDTEDDKQKQHQIIWLGNLPIVEFDHQKAYFTFMTLQDMIEVELPKSLGIVMQNVFENFLISNSEKLKIGQLEEIIENQEDTNFKKLINSDFWRTLRKKGLLLIR